MRRRDLATKGIALSSIQHSQDAKAEPLRTASADHYRPGIDGLRAIAIISVFVFHLNREWLPGGFVGVDVFFVISGYLITSILLRDCKRGRFSLAKFYQRRIARLFPAFFTVVLATIVGAFFIYSTQDLASSGSSLTAATLSLANMKFMVQGNYFSLSPDAQPFLHYWSLSVEEQFYLLFPMTFRLLYLKANRYMTVIVAALCCASLLTCIVVTRAIPVWAFYLLPTRAWELLAGVILAVSAENLALSLGDRSLRRAIALTGLVLILASLFCIHEGAGFPGYVAALPVIGTALVLGANAGSRSVAEQILSWKPFVVVGRMSYSLYLWHWSVFSLVDYRLYLESPAIRTALKVGLTLVTATACHLFIESPGRVFLNHPRKRLTAYVFLAVALLIFVPMGIAIRKSNYVNAELSDVKHGGLVYNGNLKNGTIVLMGDSHGSMYGRTIRDIAAQLHLRLNVISVAAGTPLPSSSDQPSPLWTDSLEVVRREKPNVLVLACNWMSKLKDDPGSLQIAISELRKYASRIVLITQPPQLPEGVNREAFRHGLRPPFWEGDSQHRARLAANARVKQSADSESVAVLDVETHFLADDGSVRFSDSAGRQLYHDGDHLSGVGADLVEADVMRAILGHIAH